MSKLIFAFVYKKWLWNDFHKNYDTVLEVLGWRTARIESNGYNRRVISPCFKLFGINFD